MATVTTSSPAAAPLMLDWLLPDYDSTLIEHRVLDGDLDAVYRAIRGLSPRAVQPSGRPAPSSAGPLPPTRQMGRCGSATCPRTATACSVSLRPFGSMRTLVSYEARTQALDADSRAHFLRYWRAVRPGVAIVMRAFLAAVAKEMR